VPPLPALPGACLPLTPDALPPAVPSPAVVTMTRWWCEPVPVLARL
jgi:hypothetical protein